MPKGSDAFTPLGFLVISEGADLKDSGGSFATVIYAAVRTVDVFSFLKRTASTNFFDEKRLLTSTTTTDVH